MLACCTDPHMGVQSLKTLSTVRALLLLCVSSLADRLQRQAVGVVPAIPLGTVGEVVSKSLKYQ